MKEPFLGCDPLQQRRVLHRRSRPAGRVRNHGRRKTVADVVNRCDLSREAGIQPCEHRLLALYFSRRDGPQGLPASFFLERRARESAQYARHRGSV
jgi:hypothetical protein